MFAPTCVVLISPSEVAQQHFVRAGVEQQILRLDVAMLGTDSDRRIGEAGRRSGCNKRARAEKKR
jgi:hypothetical protein